MPPMARYVARQVSDGCAGIFKVTLSKRGGPVMAFNAVGSVFEFDQTVKAGAPGGASAISLSSGWADPQVGTVYMTSSNDVMRQLD